MRRHIVLFLTLVIWTGSLTLLAVAWNERSLHLRGVENATIDANLPYRIPRSGVNADLRQYTTTQLSNQLMRMKNAGMIWVRQKIYWTDVEKSRGVFDWSLYDPMIASLSAQGLSLVPVFVETPIWAASAAFEYLPTLPPEDPHDFAIFVAAFVARYSDTVDTYQIWDEPNIYDGWGRTPPHAAQYIAMLAETYRVIHAGDPNTTVLAAALAPTTESNERNISDWDYLRALYQLGVAEFSDGIAAKAYGFNASPKDRTVSEDVLNFSRVVQMRQIMQEFHDAGTPLWLSEWGWNALPQDWQGEPSIWGQVTLDERVNYTLAALERMEQEWHWLGGAIMTMWQPSQAINDPIWGFALLNPDDSSTVLLQRLEALPRPNTPRNGFFPARNTSALYSGIWSFSALGADIGWLETSDSQVSFAFSGRDVSLKLRQGNYVAFLYPTVDGRPATETRADTDGNTYIYLRSDSQAPEVTTNPVSRNLALGNHTLSLVADKGWDQWALIGFAVSDGNLAVAYDQFVTISAVTVLTASVSLLIGIWQAELNGVIRLLQRVAGTLSRRADTGIGIIVSIGLMLSLLLTFPGTTPSILRKDTTQFALAIVVSGGLIALEVPAILVLLATAILFLLIINRLMLGLTLIVLWAPFYLFPLALFRFAFPMSEYLLLLTVAAWVIKSLTVLARQRQMSVSQFQARALRFHPIDIALFGLFACGTVALIWSDMRSAALTEWRVLIVEPALFYCILRTSKLHWDDLVTLASALVSAGVIVCIIGLVTYVSGDSIIRAEAGVWRLASVYGSPNNAALFIGRCIPFVFACVLTSTGRIKHGFIALMALLVITIVLTQSTGALVIGVPGALITMLFWQYGRRAFVPAITLTVSVAGLAVFGAAISERFAKLFSLTEGTNFIRIRVWESALNILRDHPLTGLGLDQFLYAYRGTYVKPDAISDSQLSHPHNFVLDVWMRLGFIGIVVFAWLQLLFWRTSYRLWKRGNNAQQVLILGTIGCMAITLAHGLVDNSVFVQDLIYVFMLNIATIAILDDRVIRS